MNVVTRALGLIFLLTVISFKAQAMEQVKSSYSQMELSTVSVLEKEGQLWVTIDQDNINVVNWSFLQDLNKLADELETDMSVKVVIFQSGQDAVFLAHAAGDSFKDIAKEFPSS